MLSVWHQINTTKQTETVKAVQCRRLKRRVRCLTLRAPSPWLFSLFWVWLGSLDLLLDFLLSSDSNPSFTSSILGKGTFINDVTQRPLTSFCEFTLRFAYLYTCKIIIFCLHMQMLIFGDGKIWRCINETVLDPFPC